MSLKELSDMIDQALFDSETLMEYFQKNGYNPTESVFTALVFIVKTSKANNKDLDIVRELLEVIWESVVLKGDEDENSE